MKFDKSYFWKHKNCMDVFILAGIEQPVEGGVMLIGSDWLTQGVDVFWTTPVVHDNIFIKDSEYDNWIAYTPKGNYYGL